LREHLLVNSLPIALDVTNSPGDQDAGHEQVWINELAASLPWISLFAEPARIGDHINVKEMRALRLLISKYRVSLSSSRFSVMLDSLVALGAAAKGRSPSGPLNDELRAMLGDIIGYDLYPAYHFVPTRLNPSDDPSRKVPLRPPRQPVPAWFEAAADGDYTALDVVSKLPPQCKGSAEWLRFVLSLARLWGN